MFWFSCFKSWILYVYCMFRFDKEIWKLLVKRQAIFQRIRVCYLKSEWFFHLQVYLFLLISRCCFVSFFYGLYVFCICSLIWLFRSTWFDCGSRLTKFSWVWNLVCWIMVKGCNYLAIFRFCWGRSVSVWCYQSRDCAVVTSLLVL